MDQDALALSDQSSMRGHPTHPVGVGFVTLLCVMHTATWMLLLPVVQVLLPRQVQTLFGESGKVAALAVITGIGAVPPLIVTPLAGALSDRTTGRWGRRRPWLLVGGLFTFVILLAQAHARDLWSLVCWWTALHVGTSILLANLTAFLPDRVPVRQRATVAALVTFALPLAAIVGLVLVQRTGTTTNAYTLLGLIGLGVTVGGAVFLPDAPTAPCAWPPFAPRRFLKGCWIGLRHHPDVGWAWLTRFLVYLSYASATGYLYYYLQDVVHLANPTKGVTVFQSVIVGTNIVAALASGILSDRWQQRKRFVMAASFLLGGALLLLGCFPSWAMVLVAAGLVGMGFGIYLGVDLALITQVLPSTRDHGRDLGLLTLANALPQVVGTPLAAWVILTLHSYLALFVMAALLANLGGILVTRIQGIR